MDEMYSLAEYLNDEFGSEWCFTGSSAICFYLNIINNDISKKYIEMLGNPNDIDILVINKKKQSLQEIKYIGRYYRESSNQLTSSKYINKDNNKTIDLTFVYPTKIRTYDRIKLHDFDTLKRDYFEYMDEVDVSKKSLLKIEILSFISTYSDLFQEKSTAKRKFNSNFSPLGNVIDDEFIHNNNRYKTPPRER